MYILLSSGAQKRYRDDILRCMAAPFGAVIQFRYEKSIVEDSIINATDQMHGQSALVCSLNVQDTFPDEGGQHAVIPIREVVIDRVWSVGSTIVVALRVYGFAHVSDLESFRKSFYVSQHPPRNADPKAESGGKWFFEAPDELEASIPHGVELSSWEAITQQLIAIPQFRREPFFWTVLGLKEGMAEALEADGTFGAWPDSLRLDTFYTLAIYVYRPSLHEDSSDNELERTGWSGHLLISSDPPTTSLSSSTIEVDSPYDLKRWSFQIKRPHLTYWDQGWLRIGVEVADKSMLADQEKLQEESIELVRKELRQMLVGEAQWDIELPLTFDSPWPRVVTVSVVLGVGLALPSVINILQQVPAAGQHKVLACLLATAAGIGTAIVAVFQIRKPA